MAVLDFLKMPRPEQKCLYSDKLRGLLSKRKNVEKEFSVRNLSLLCRFCQPMLVNGMPAFETTAVRDDETGGVGGRRGRFRESLLCLGCTRHVSLRWLQQNPSTLSGHLCVCSSTKTMPERIECIFPFPSDSVSLYRTAVYGEAMVARKVRNLLPAYW